MCNTIDTKQLFEMSVGSVMYITISDETPHGALVAPSPFHDRTALMTRNEPETLCYPFDRKIMLVTTDDKGIDCELIIERPRNLAFYPSLTVRRRNVTGKGPEYEVYSVSLDMLAIHTEIPIPDPSAPRPSLGNATGIVKTVNVDETLIGDDTSTEKPYSTIYDKFDIDVARQDIIHYLSEQDEAYFTERARTKAEVLDDKELIDRVAAEHLKHCIQFGNNRMWSMKNACDCEPGIRKPS